MLTEAAIASHAAKIRDDGFTVIEGAASPALVEGLKQAVERIEREHDLGPAKTSFEGFKTLRINNLLTYGEIFWQVPLHDNVLPVVEHLLDKECLLSSFCSLVLGPGQEAQPIHEDTSSFRCQDRISRSQSMRSGRFRLSGMTTARHGSCPAATGSRPRPNTARTMTPSRRPCPPAA